MEKELAVKAPGIESGPKANLKSLDEVQLEQFAASIGEPPYRGRQLFRWIYGKHAVDFASMTSLPAALRQRLNDLAELPRIGLIEVRTASDRTLKALCRLPSGRHVETVLIPDFDEEGRAKRLTVCVSSQVGCAMGCRFCATGLMGFSQNLTAGEIVDQVAIMNEIALTQFDRTVSNVVFMGMGEPLLNYDNVVRATSIIMNSASFCLAPRRITVSTVGLARRVRQLADDETRFRLAISLHAPTDEKRSSIMPVNRSESTDLRALRDAVQYYSRKSRSRVTYEYCMFDGFNDSDEDARGLAEVVRWAPSKVNLIMYNPVSGLDFRRTTEERLNRFIRILVGEGVNVTVRQSRGQDIDAACGQLALQRD